MASKEKNAPVRKERKEEETTTITPWRPEDYLSRMDHMFDDFEGRFERLLTPFPGPWLSHRWLEAPGIRHPSVDLIDSGKEFRVLAEVPGIPKEKLDIVVTDREIRIEGEAKTDIQEEKEGFLRRERGYSKILRSVTLPEPVIADKAEASLDNGVLEIRVPKKTPTEVTKHRIVVK